MIRNIYKVLNLSLFTILLTACNGSKPIKERIEESASCRTIPVSHPPKWVFNEIPKSFDYYFGVGVSEGFDIDFNEMKKRSRSYAESELSSSIETRVSSNLRQVVRKQNTKESSSLSNTVEQTIKSNSELLLSDVEVDDTWFNRETCQLWTKVRLSKSSLEESQKQMKTMVLLKLERASKNVDSIKKTIESDPNVILRKYGLTINGGDYFRALQLPIKDNELFSILDLYEKFGSNPNSFAFGLGVTLSEPYKSGIFKISRGGYTAPTPTLFQMVAGYKGGDERVIERLVKYYSLKKYNDIHIESYAVKNYDIWFESKKSKLEIESKKLTSIHEKNRKEIVESYNSHLSRSRYEKENTQLESKIKENWRQHRISHDELYDVKNQISYRNNFKDHIVTVHFAACFGSEKNLSILKKYGFLKIKKTQKGYSPLEIAETCKNKETMEYLN